MNLHPSKLTPGALETAGLVGAECVYDPELHTGPRATIETAEQTTAREDVAREVCATCPVRARCLARALDVRPRSGVWAAVSAGDIAAGEPTAESDAVSAGWAVA